MMLSALNAAKAYQDRQWRVIPVNYKEKTCHLKDWPNYQLNPADLDSVFASPRNVGVLLGASELTDVDVDSEYARPFIKWLPPTDLKWGRQGNQNSHHLYKGESTTRPFKNSEGMIIEIRSKGCYAVVPPSVHPSGEHYVWHSEGESGHGAGLEESVIKIAVAATLLAAWKNGVRHHLALAISGFLLKAGWAEEVVLDLVASVASAADDTEIADRKNAVHTTIDSLKKGGQVAGFSKLTDLLGPQNANSIRSWVGTKSIDIAKLSSEAKTSLQKRVVAETILADLKTLGVFYQVDGQELLYFYKPECQPYSLDSLEFRAFCGEIYGINGKEPIWSYVEEHLITYCLRKGQKTEYFQFSRYQEGKLYIHAGGHRVFRLDGSTIETIDNGDDGILFKTDPSLKPIEPVYDMTESLVRKHLVNVANAVDPERLDLYELYIYSLFFEALLPTKPIVVFTGPKGSGKTSGGRALKRSLHGPNTNVDTGMTDKQDAFYAAISNNSLVCMDNVDSLVSWLADALATIATGATLKRRKLYATNTLIDYKPRCFVIITSRNPECVTRDDVVDRLLLIEVSRLKEFIPESQMLEELDANRPAIWGELLTNLNKMVAELAKPKLKQPVSYRLADWTRLVMTFGPILDIKDVDKKLKAMEASKVEFALDDQPLVQGLADWIDGNPDHEFISTGELFQKIEAIYEMKGQKFSIKTSRAFGVQLKNLRLELGSRYVIEDKAGPSNKKLFRFAKLKPIEESKINGLADKL